MSRFVADSEYKQRLTVVQEALILQINQLTDRGLPPTSNIVRNLAEERTALARIGLGVLFQNRLKSLFLRNIDSKRHKAEYAPVFKQFYDLVLLNGYWLNIYASIYTVARKKTNHTPGKANH